MDTEAVLTIDQAADYCKVSRQTITRRISQRILPSHYGVDRRQKLIRQSDLDRLLRGEPATA